LTLSLYGGKQPKRPVFAERCKKKDIGRSVVSLRKTSSVREKTRGEGLGGGGGEKKGMYLHVLESRKLSSHSEGKEGPQCEVDLSAQSKSSPQEKKGSNLAVKKRYECCAVDLSQKRRKKRDTRGKGKGIKCKIRKVARRRKRSTLHYLKRRVPWKGEGGRTCRLKRSSIR